jgi:hypothetical protein
LRRAGTGFRPLRATASWRRGTQGKSGKEESVFRFFNIVTAALPIVNVESLTPEPGKEQTAGVEANRKIPLAALVMVVALVGPAGCWRSAEPAAVTPNASFGGTDLAWIEITIAMDEQVLPLLQLVPSHSREPSVQALGVQVQAVTDAELDTLRSLHDQAGLPAANPHEGMPMPGVVTVDVVNRAAKLSGTKFDTLAVDQIRDYLEHGKDLAESEQKSGVEAQTRALALNVIRTRTEALSSIK